LPGGGLLRSSPAGQAQDCLVCVTYVLLSSSFLVLCFVLSKMMHGLSLLRCPPRRGLSDYQAKYKQRGQSAYLFFLYLFSKNACPSKSSQYSEDVYPSQIFSCIALGGHRSIAHVPTLTVTALTAASPSFDTPFE
jgi:hypothetical protein